MEFDKEISDMDAGELAAAKDAIDARLMWMHENLSGCDWCCGGGDEEADELDEQLKQIDARLANLCLIDLAWPVLIQAEFEHLDVVTL